MKLKKPSFPAPLVKSAAVWIILGLVIILSAQAGFCTEEIAQHIPAAADIPQKQAAPITLTLSKFVVTMIGVVLSSVVIWAGLSIYNRFFVKNGTLRGSENDDILNTPKTIEDAVTFFIKKNKLK